MKSNKYFSLFFTNPCTFYKNCLSVGLLYRTCHRENTIILFLEFSNTDKVIISISNIFIFFLYTMFTLTIISLNLIVYYISIFIKTSALRTFNLTSTLIQIYKTVLNLHQKDDVTLPVLISHTYIDFFQLAIYNILKNAIKYKQI